MGQVLELKGQVRRRLALVMNGSDILSIMDGEGNGNLRLIHQYQMGSRGMGVAALGNIVCVVYDSPGAVHSCALDIIDVSNPYHPVVLSTKLVSAAMGTMKSVTPIYPHNFVITTTRGFVGIDVSSPTKPIPLTSYRTEKSEEILTISLTSIDDWRDKKLDGVKFNSPRYQTTIPVEPWIGEL